MCISRSGPRFVAREVHAWNPGACASSNTAASRRASGPSPGGWLDVGVAGGVGAGVGGGVGEGVDDGYG